MTAIGDIVADGEQTGPRPSGHEWVGKVVAEYRGSRHFPGTAYRVQGADFFEWTAPLGALRPARPDEEARYREAVDARKAGPS